MCFVIGPSFSSLKRKKRAGSGDPPRQDRAPTPPTRARHSAHAHCEIAEDEVPRPPPQRHEGGAGVVDDGLLCSGSRARAHRSWLPRWAEREAVTGWPGLPRPWHRGGAPLSGWQGGARALAEPLGCGPATKTGSRHRGLSGQKRGRRPRAQPPVPAADRHCPTAPQSELTSPKHGKMTWYDNSRKSC